MSRTSFLTLANRKAIAITALQAATKNLVIHTKKMKNLSPSAQAALFQIWDTFCSSFEAISQVKQENTLSSDSTIIDDCVYEARTAASHFFITLQNVLQKEWPKKIAKVSKIIKNTKKSQDMDNGGETANACKHFENETKQYQEGIEENFKLIMESPLYQYSNLDMPSNTLKTEFQAKKAALQAKEAADAEKGPGCCGLFSRSKRRVASNEEDVSLINYKK